MSLRTSGVAVAVSAINGTYTAVTVPQTSFDVHQQTATKHYDDDSTN